MSLGLGQARQLLGIDVIEITASRSYRIKHWLDGTNGGCL